MDKMNHAWILVAIAAGAAIAFQACGRYAYNYVLRDGRIQVVLFGGIPIKSIPLADISAMREVRWRETLRPDFGTLRLGNRVLGRILELRRDSGVFRKVLITPDDPDAFLAAWRNARLPSNGRTA